jgi:hypothetical protein
MAFDSQACQRLKCARLDLRNGGAVPLALPRPNDSSWIRDATPIPSLRDSADGLSVSSRDFIPGYRMPRLCRSVTGRLAPCRLRGTTEPPGNRGSHCSARRKVGTGAAPVARLSKSLSEKFVARLSKSLSEKFIGEIHSCAHRRVTAEVIAPPDARSGREHPLSHDFPSR